MGSGYISSIFIIVVVKSMICVFIWSMLTLIYKSIDEHKFDSASFWLSIAFLLAIIFGIFAVVDIVKYDNKHVLKTPSETALSTAYKEIKTFDIYIKDGEGCNICGGKSKLDNEKFIQKANEIHNNKYDYSKVDYKNNKTYINIICPKHGEFIQLPRHHLEGRGCPSCKSSKGEKIIRDWLVKNNISFEEQKQFVDCKYKNNLKFDFTCQI